MEYVNIALLPFCLLGVMGGHTHLVDARLTCPLQSCSEPHTPRALAPHLSQQPHYPCESPCKAVEHGSL